MDFGVRAGEVHGLVGENGAGKSTLVGGVYQPDAGRVLIEGAVVGVPSRSGPANEASR